MTTVTTTGARPAQPAPSGDTLKGFFYALAAYLFWGILPLYMKLVAHLPTVEVLAHRVIWSVPIALVLLVWLGRTSDIRRALASPRTMLQAAVAAAGNRAWLLHQPAADGADRRRHPG
jgi:chloramphenicol-sensitive protein RarD